MRFRWYGFYRQGKGSHEVWQQITAKVMALKRTMIFAGSFFFFLSFFSGGWCTEFFYYNARLLFAQHFQSRPSWGLSALWSYYCRVVIKKQAESVLRWEIKLWFHLLWLKLSCSLTDSRPLPHFAKITKHFGVWGKFPLWVVFRNDRVCLITEHKSGSISEQVKCFVWRSFAPFQIY